LKGAYIAKKEREQLERIILASSGKKCIAMEVEFLAIWYKYVGIDGKIVGVDRLVCLP
jgi:hypothetical protein